MKMKKESKKEKGKKRKGEQKFSLFKVEVISKLILALHQLGQLFCQKLFPKYPQ